MVAAILTPVGACVDASTEPTVASLAVPMTSSTDTVVTEFNVIEGAAFESPLLGCCGGGAVAPVSTAPGPAFPGLTAGLATELGLAEGTGTKASVGIGWRGAAGSMVTGLAGSTLVTSLGPATTAAGARGPGFGSIEGERGMV